VASRARQIAWIRCCHFDTLCLELICPATATSVVFLHSDLKSGTKRMSTEHLVPETLRDTYRVREWRNATGVLQTACPDEWAEIIDVLAKFRLLKSEIVQAGGSRSPISKGIDGAFYALGWREKQFMTSIKVDDQIYESPTHKVDCFKGRVAIVEQQGPILRPRLE
jgi:Restriction endonuclease BglII